MARGVVIPAHLASTISVPIHATRHAYSPLVSSIGHLLEGSMH
jgi:hypothetical protein